MEIQHDYNYNDPLQLKEVFRVSNDAGTVREYAGLTNVCWEDIRQVDEYFYPDDWKTYPGEKYYILLHGQQHPKLILGTYREIVDYWRQMRRDYPIFVGKPPEDEDQ